MVNLDLSDADSVRFGSTEALAIRIANTDVWTKPEQAIPIIPMEVGDLSTASVALPNGSSGSLTVAPPANAAIGDLLVGAYLSRYDTSLEAPSGWSEIGTQLATYGPMGIYTHKVTDLSSIPAFNFSAASGTSARALGLIFRIPAGSSATGLQGIDMGQSITTDHYEADFASETFGSDEIDLITLGSFTETTFDNGSGITPDGYLPIIQVRLTNSYRAFFGLFAKTDSQNQALEPKVTWFGDTTDGGASNPSGGFYRFKVSLES